MEYEQKIIDKYRAVANLPDWLFGFTFPLRRLAVRGLRLQPGDRVLDLGCGSGASFKILHEAVGPSGRIVGVDISPEMIQAAKKRVGGHGWQNIELIESSVEELDLVEPADGLLLFAMHDVLTSAAALENMFNFLKPGARVVAVGPQLAAKFPGKLLNPVIDAVYRRFAVSQEDKDQPWRRLASRLDDSHVRHFGPGILYLFTGTKR